MYGMKKQNAKKGKPVVMVAVGTMKPKTKPKKKKPTKPKY
jgi:hypothetical protein|tara:strand:+ start:906 stop:1025 length:120 start_codon:yes stop_codon:yes gene_type:complete